MSTSRHGHYRESRDILESLRRREDALDRWERDLRFREDSLMREKGRYVPGDNNNSTRRINPRRKREGHSKEKDYSSLAAPRETYTEDSVDSVNKTKNETSC